MSIPEDKRDASVQLSVIHFVDRELEKERKLTEAERDRLREVFTARFDAMDKANYIANTELLRRLAELNHAHDEMVRDKAHYQSVEGFQMFFKDYGTFKEATNSTLANYAGRTIVIGALLVIGLAALMRYWHP